MKKTLKSLLIAAFCGIALAFAMTSCGSKLERAVKDVQKDLPQDVGNGFAMTGCEIQGNYVELFMTTDESLFSLGDETIQELFPTMLAESGMTEELLQDKDCKEMLRACKDENKGLRITIKGLQSGVSIPVYQLSPEDIQADSRI